jgi:hypothetical protein
MKASHTFNLLDARRAISVTERQRYILRVRTLSRSVAETYVAQREKLGFPGLKKAKEQAAWLPPKPLLIELGTEELPPKALDELSAAFLRGIVRWTGQARDRCGFRSGQGLCVTASSGRVHSERRCGAAGAGRRTSWTGAHPPRSMPNGPAIQGVAGFCAIVRRRRRAAGKARNRQGRLVRLACRQAGSAAGGIVAGNRRRSIEGIADPRRCAGAITTTASCARRTGW